MKAILLFIFVCVVSASQEDIVDRVANLTDLWQATVYEQREYPLMGALTGKDLEEAKLYSAFKNVPQIIDSDLPVNFDCRTAFPGCVHPVRDQGACNSCWAFAASGALGDRFCTFTKKESPELSPQYLVSCQHSPLDCWMGDAPRHAWSLLAKYGTTTAACLPYRSGNGNVTECTGMCEDGSKPVMYKAANYTHVGSYFSPAKYISDIMRELLRGPVDATFNVYEDLYSYRSGIYHHVTGSYKGLHSVKVIGYGTEGGVDYWLVQNSWGRKWGIGGLFKIKKGADECIFERAIYAGDPAL